MKRFNLERFSVFSGIALVFFAIGSFFPAHHDAAPGARIIQYYASASKLSPMRPAAGRMEALHYRTIYETL